MYITPSIHRDTVLFQMARGGERALTTRQREVLQMIAEGRSSKEMAAILNVSPRTIEFHKSGVMTALDLHTTAELVRYAIERGIAST
jgi:DNA-binding NarL/FixJ family response regulator